MSKKIFRILIKRASQLPNQVKFKLSETAIQEDRLIRIKLEANSPAFEPIIDTLDKDSTFGGELLKVAEREGLLNTKWK